MQKEIIELLDLLPKSFFSNIKHYTNTCILLFNALDEQKAHILLKKYHIPTTESEGYDEKYPSEEDIKEMKKKKDKYRYYLNTLKCWVEDNSIKEFNKYIDKINLLKEINNTEYSVANFMYYLFGHRIKCTSIVDNEWSIFNDRRYIRDNSDFRLWNKISTIVKMEVQGYIIDLNENYYRKKIQELKNLELNLERTEFKKNVMIECKYLFAQ